MTLSLALVTSSLRHSRSLGLIFVFLVNSLEPRGPCWRGGQPCRQNLRVQYAECELEVSGETHLNTIFCHEKRMLKLSRSFAILHKIRIMSNTYDLKRLNLPGLQQSNHLANDRLARHLYSKKYIPLVECM